MDTKQAIRIMIKFPWLGILVFPGFANTGREQYFLEEYIDHVSVRRGDANLLRQIAMGADGQYHARRYVGIIAGKVFHFSGWSSLYPDDAPVKTLAWQIAEQHAETGGYPTIIVEVMGGYEIEDREVDWTSFDDNGENVLTIYRMEEFDYEAFFSNEKPFSVVVSPHVDDEDEDRLIRLDAESIEKLLGEEESEV